MQRNECHTRPKQQPTLFACSCNQHTCCMQAADNQADARRRERSDAHCSTHKPTEARVTQAMNACRGRVVWLDAALYVKSTVICKQ